MGATQYEENMKIRGSDELYRLLAVAHNRSHRNACDHGHPGLDLPSLRYTDTTTIVYPLSSLARTQIVHASKEASPQGQMAPCQNLLAPEPKVQSQPATSEAY